MWHAFNYDRTCNRFQKWSPLTVFTYELQELIDGILNMIVKETHSHKHKSAKGSKSESKF